MGQAIQVRARLTREGWYYLAVLTFIVGGAALCHVNLLVVLGGMMLAPLLINWRMSLAVVQGVTVRRLPLRATPAGEPVVAEFEIHNPRRWLAAWFLTIEDRWRRVDRDADPTASTWKSWLIDRCQELLDIGHTKAVVFIPAVGPGETARAHYELLVSRRGEYQLLPLRLRSCFPLGLVEAVATIPRTAEVLVLPRIGRLSAEWTQRITVALADEGERQLQRRASDGEFFAVRPWQSGDSTRWMHWRTTARAGRPMVRQFERDTNSLVVLILDPYLPPQPTSGERARLEAAISFVATAVADLSRRNVARLAVVVASPETPFWVGGRSAGFLEHLLSELAELPGVAGDHRAAASEVVERELSGATCVLLVTSRPEEAAESASDLPHALHVANAEFAALYSLE